MTDRRTEMDGWAMAVMWPIKMAAQFSTYTENRNLQFAGYKMLLADLNQRIDFTTIDSNIISC